MPDTTVRILPWTADKTAREEASIHFSPAALPENFDVFDNLGEVAVRSGPGGLGGFQTITTISSRKVAPSILLIDFTQSYPKNAEILVGATNPYQSDLIESLLDGIRLFSGGDPHQHKAFHIDEEQLVNTVIKWPLTEILSKEFALTSAHLSSIKQMFLQVWQVRVASRQVSSCKVLTTALEYYYLTSTISDRRTNFMHLMIAFEALFKSREEESASAAGARLAKLTATTKEKFNEIRRFMWSTKEALGCCQLRNAIVHGGSGAFPSDTDKKLRELIRHALIRLIYLGKV